MNDKAVEVIKEGGMVVMPTDTIYGLLASAMDEAAVERLRAVRGKANDKPLIVLISKLEDLAKFNIKLSPEQKAKLQILWPGPVSIILPCQADEFAYLHRGGGTFGVRLPANEKFRDFITKTGPLVAPSANLPYQPPAKNVDEARKYFGDKVDLYIAGEIKTDQPSTLITLSKTGQIKVLRQGVAVIPESQ